MKLMLVAAVTGAGVVTGLLFAFSNFVMRALADFPNETGMFAMKRINETIINPVFLLFFFGTPILCVVIAIRTILQLDTAADIYVLSGAIAYLVGPFAITGLFNVPLNSRLAKQELTIANEVWPVYQEQWQRWNHIRTYIGIAAIALLAAGLGAG